MITNHKFAHCHGAQLECDACGAGLLPQRAALKFFAVDLRLKRGDEPAPEQRRMLREMAQHDAWLYVLLDVWGRSNRDLCPNCFKMPPEG